MKATAGLIHKATRGELALTLPTGLVRTSQGTVQNPQPGSPSPPVVGVRDIFTMSFSQ